MCLLATYGVQAQEITGRILEKTPEGKIGLPGANVLWLGTTKGVVTDDNGNFVIQWDPVGQLVVSYLGYNTDTLRIAENTPRIECYLEQTRERLEDVEVSGKKPGTIMTTNQPLIQQVITGEELCKAACCNLGESFETNASVDVSYADAVTGAKQIQLLGLTGKYVQMMTENMPNFRGLASLYGLNYIPGPWMSAISVSKGTGSVVNGYESMAGQISVDYKKPQDPEKLSLNAFFSDEGMYEFNSNLSFRLGSKWSTMFLLHGDWFNESHDGNKDGFLDMPKKTQYNVMNRWNYRDEYIALQFGGKFIDEQRRGGQGGHEVTHTGNKYEINIDTRRYEAFLKMGYLMPQYENTSMALLLSYSDHTQDSRYGIRVYDANQKSFFANYIYQSIFGNNPDQMFSAGISYNYDSYDEKLGYDSVRINPSATPQPYARLKQDEKVPGAFFQYTGIFFDQKLTLMAGLRYDDHNVYGNLWTPRIHIMFKPDMWTNIKATAGRGARTTNVLAENSYLMASSSPFLVNGKDIITQPGELKNLKMEKAWNFGINVNRQFELFGRILNVNLDYYHTKFTDQVVVDNETRYNEVNFYNLDGKSYSNCYQAEVKYEIIPRLETTVAYRYNDVKTTINDELVRTPLSSKYKGLLNMTYFTNFKKWQFDFTTQFNGPGRIPAHPGLTETTFDDFQIMNAQVTKYFRTWSVYGGCENIGDFKQKNPIIDAQNPWGSQFDASKVWGPIHGRKFYLGIRFALDRKS